MARTLISEIYRCTHAFLSSRSPLAEGAVLWLVHDSSPPDLSDFNLRVSIRLLQVQDRVKYIVFEMLLLKFALLLSFVLLIGNLISLKLR